MTSYALSKNTVRFLGNFLGILIAYFILRRLFTSWQDIEVSLVSLHKGYLFLSFLLLLSGHASHALLTYYSNTSTGHKISLVDAFRIWFLSQAGKYIPGGIWLFVSKAKLYKNQGISTSKASFLIFWETMALLATALFISFPAVKTLLASQALSVLFLMGLVLAAGLSLSLSFWKKSESVFPSIKKISYGLQHINRIQFLGKLFASALVSWILVGISFYFLVISLSPTVALADTFAIFPLSWAIGFLTLIAPQGIGPREFALSVMLEPIIGTADTLAVIIISRIMWTLSDSLLILLAFALKKKAVV